MATIAPSGQDIAGNRCQADGCMADLSGLRRYFRRYHVCETHIRSQVVLIGGRQVRFCDQCSTFHALALFDGARRTCREKLEQNRLRRRIRKAQNAGVNIGGQQGGNAASAAGGGAGAAAGSCDDADSDDQPGNGGAGADGDDMTGGIPALRGNSLRGRDRKRPSNLSGQGGRRQQPAPRQGPGSDVTRALHVNRVNAGQLHRTGSQSPEPEDEELGQHTPVMGGAVAVREDRHWIMPGGVADGGVPGLVRGGMFMGGEVHMGNGMEAGLGGIRREPALRAIELGGMAPEWQNLHHQDLRDQEQLLTSGAGSRDGLQPPRGIPQQHQQQLGHQVPHGAHWQQTPKSQQQVPLPSVPEQQVENWETETGGVITLPNAPVQGHWRLHGGSMPNIPPEPPGSPHAWHPATEARATWPSVPAVLGPDAPLNGRTVHERPAHDGAYLVSGGAAVRESTHGQYGPQALNSAAMGYGPILNGMVGEVGPMGRMPGRVGAHLSDEDNGAPAVTLLSRVQLHEAELQRQQPLRSSHAAHEPLSPVKPNVDLLPGANALPPAKKAELQLKMEAGLLQHPRSTWGAGQLDPQGQHEHRGGMYGRDAQDTPAWPAGTGGVHPQAGGWVSAQGTVMHAMRTGTGGMAQQAGGAAVFSFHGQAPNANQPNVMEERPMSEGSSVYTGDEAAAVTLGRNDQEVDMGTVQRIANDVAEGKYLGSLGGFPPNLESCPSILEKKSFVDDVQSAMNDTQRWAMERHQQQHLVQQAQHMQQQGYGGLRDVQVVVNIMPPPAQPQQAMQSPPEETVTTLLDHLAQEQRRREQTPVMQQQVQQRQALQNCRPSALQQQDTLKQSFGELYQSFKVPDKSHIHISAFHLQPAEDLDTDSDYQPSNAGAASQWPTQTSQITSARATAPAAGAPTRFAGVAQAAPVSLSRFAAAPMPPQQQHHVQQVWPGIADASGWRGHGSDVAPTSAYDPPARLPPPPPSPPPNHGTQQGMQQLGGGRGEHLSQLHPSDQELIRSTLESLAAQAPPFRTGGQPRVQASSDSRDMGRDRDINGPDGMGGGQVMYAPQRPGQGDMMWGGADATMVGAGERRPLQLPQLPPMQQRPLQQQGSARMDLDLRLDAAPRIVGAGGNQNTEADGDPQMAFQGPDSLQLRFSTISDLGSAELATVDSTLFQSFTELQANGGPAGDGGTGVHGGPPTPPPRGGDGFVTGAGAAGFSRAEPEGSRWGVSERQILAGLKQLQGADYATNDDWMSAPGGAEVLRAWSWQQQQQEQHQQQQRQERSASHGALMGGDRHAQQQQRDHQSQAYISQQWDQPPSQDGPPGLYGVAFDANEAAWRQNGDAGGRHNVSHVALKLSHARAENLSANMLEQLQEALQGGGTAALPKAVREGCVEVLVEVMHSCPATELCERLFCTAMPAASADAFASPVAAVAAREQVRGWVGGQVFDACERVTMQVLGGPVLDCKTGERPQLRRWDEALQHAGMAFTSSWPGVLMLDSGPPVLVADRIKTQQIQVYGPAEMESHLGRVRLCVRMAGGSYSLGEVKAVAVTSKRVTLSAVADAETQPQHCLDSATDPEEDSDTAHGGRSYSFGSDNVHVGARAGFEDVSPVRSAQRQQQQPRPLTENGQVAATADVEIKVGVRELSGAAREERPGGNEVAGPRPFHCLVIDKSEQEGEDAPPTFSFSRSGAAVATPPDGTSQRDAAGAVGETTELFRSCFLTASPLLSSQPSSPRAPKRTYSPRRWQQRMQRPLDALPEGEQLQHPPEEGNMVAMRPRSRSADGAAPTSLGTSANNQLSEAASPAPPSLPMRTLKCKSLNRQASSRRKQSCAPSATAHGSRGLDPLSQRASFCSSAALTTAMTLNDGLSSLSSATTAFTTATTLYEKMSLRSEWSSASTLLSFGGHLGSSNGAGASLPGRPCEPQPQPPVSSLMSGSSDRTVGSALISRTPTACGSSSTTVAPSAGPSPEVGSPMESGTQAYQSRDSASAAAQGSAEAGTAAEQLATGLAARRAVSPGWLQTSFPLSQGTARDGTSEADRLPGLDAETPRLVIAPASLLAQPATVPAQQIGGGSISVAAESMSDTKAAGSRGHLRGLELQLPVLERAGLALLEATGGHMVVSCWPLLVVETAAQREDLLALWRELSGRDRPEVWWALAADLGLVLGNLPRRADCACDHPDAVSGNAPSGEGVKGSVHEDVCMQQQFTPATHAPNGVAAAPFCVAADRRPSAPLVATPSAAAQPAATRTYEGDAAGAGAGLSSDGQKAVPELSLQPISLAAAVAERAGALDPSYCDSIKSGESTYPESWGTATAPHSACDQLPQPTVLPLPSGTASRTTRSSGSGRATRECALHVTEGVIGAAAGAAACGTGISPAADTSDGPPPVVCPGNACATDDKGCLSAFTVAAAASGEDGGQQQELQDETEEAERSSARPGCGLRRGDEVSLVSGLGSLNSEEDEEGVEGLAAVTDFMAGLKVAAFPHDDSAYGKYGSPSGPKLGYENGVAGVSLKAEAAQPAGWAAADMPTEAAKATSMGSDERVAVSTGGVSATGQPAAAGLSAVAWTALGAAVARLRAFLQNRELPALRELLSRVALAPGVNAEAVRA